MKNIKLISVIIPIYNGQDFIVRCVESIINQKKIDINSIEILLLNDGSSDSSIDVIRDIEVRYKSVVRAFDQKNSGVDRTRNRGIKLATGTYTIFVDQDDYLDDDYLSTFTEAAEDGNYDIIMGGYKRPNSKGKVLRMVSQPNTEYSVRYKISAAWAKLHRTDFLQKNSIFFYDSIIGEDIIFTMQENSLTDKIKGINYTGYNWFWNSESASNTVQRSLKNKSQIKKLIEDMIPYIKSDVDRYYLIQTGLYYLLYSGKRAHPDEFIGLYRSIFNTFKLNRISASGGRVLLFEPSGATTTTRCIIGVMILLHRLNLIPLFARFYCRSN